jgi:hypothetical protein
MGRMNQFHWHPTPWKKAKKKKKSKKRITRQAFLPPELSFF